MSLGGEEDLSRLYESAGAGDGRLGSRQPPCAKTLEWGGPVGPLGPPVQFPLVRLVRLERGGDSRLYMCNEQVQGFINRCSPGSLPESVPSRRRTCWLEHGGGVFNPSELSFRDQPPLLRELGS